MEKRKYTLEYLAEVAARYEYRNDFKLNDLHAYRAARYRGILDVICAHMKRQGDRKNRYVYEIVCHDRRVAYVGLTYRPERRLAQHSKNPDMIAEFGTSELPFRVVSDLIPSEQAAKLESGMITHYRDMMRYTIVNVASAGSLGGGYEKWNDEAIVAEAKKYATRNEFCNGSKGAYAAACAKGILDQVCSHMTFKKLPAGYWTNARIAIEAKKHTSRSALKRNCVSAYNAAIRANILNEVCGHMR